MTAFQRRFTRRGALALGGAAMGVGLGVGWACAPKPVLDKRRALLSAWGERLLIPSYRELGDLSSKLADRVGELRADPSAATLGLARDAWWAARRPLKMREVFAFGPFSEEPLRIGPTIDFWPVRPDAIEDALSEFVIGETDVEGLGAAAKGLPAVEYLLYGPDVSAESFAIAPERGAYAEALAADLVVRANELADAWEPEVGGFLRELTEAGSESAMFETLPLALSEIVSRMAYLAENVRLDKLGRPLGETADGTPQPDKAESQYSGRSAEDIRDNFAGLEQMYFGDIQSDLPGLEHYLVWRGRSFATQMREHLDRLYASIDGMGPVTEAVLADPPAVELVMERLTELQRLIQVDVINALSLVVGFNDTDGD